MHPDSNLNPTKCVLSVNSLQVEPVDMATSTAKATALTQLPLAQHCSTVDWAAVLALRSSAQMNQLGATRVAHQSSSQQPTFAHRTMPSPTTMEAGATLLALTSTSPCPCSSRLPSTALELSPSPTAGKQLLPYTGLPNFTQLKTVYFPWFFLVLSALFIKEKRRKYSR